MEPADIQKLCKWSSAVNMYMAATSRFHGVLNFLGFQAQLSGPQKESPGWPFHQGLTQPLCTHPQ